jgi:superfamily I DNA and/or RNA helicase
VASDGETTVGKKGKAVSKFYLLDRWTRGAKDAGAFQHNLLQGAAAVWNMVPEDRKACQARWQAAILEDLVSEVSRFGQDFNKDKAEIDRIFAERDMNIIRGKRIITCTTNRAARFTRAIQSASPGVILVEEAGEILEAHILTAIGQNTEQLILIGDHQQLRPKCNSYELTVDGGNGYDLDRSLFERLVRKGFPHTTLTKQHRMRPEISSIIRHMTYHNLTDADATLDCDNLRGFRDNVMFINHSELEVELEESREVRDGSSASSKQNLFEASMILKCVRYLAQQGYGSDKMVVLTLYLRQLKLLRDELS